MNKKQRNALGELVWKLEEIQGAIQEMADEEREKYDNLPESLQSGERGQAMNDAADTLEDQANEIGNIIDNLDEYAE